MSLAARFKQRRSELGMTQMHIAHVAGVSQQSVESIENGRTKKPRNLLELARALKCNPEWLLTGHNRMPIAESNICKLPVLNVWQVEMFIHNMNNGTFWEGEKYIFTDSDKSDGCFALHIGDDSMAPEFSEGDTVIIDTQLRPVPGEFVLAKCGEHDITFKKYRNYGVGYNEFELIPLNEDYPVLRSTSLMINIIGVMVEHRIYRRKR